MGKNFANVRKKTRIASSLISAVLGIALGAIVLAAAVMTMKLLGKPIPVFIYIISASAVPVSAVVFYLAFMPTDRRLAKRLDDEHRLNEKMRTMVEFKSSDDPFILLQREDADEKLGKVKFSPWRKKQLISVLIVFAVSAASLTTAFVIPGRGDYVEPENPLTEFDKQWILAELSDITATVEKADIADVLKASSVKELRALYKFVEEHDYFSEMKIEAIKSVIKIDKDLKNENTAPTIGEALSACTDSDLNEIGVELVKLNGSGVQKKINQLKSALGAGNKEDASFAADELSAAIVASGADTASPLTAVFNNLVSALRGYSNGSVASLDEAFGEAAFDAMDQVMIQTFNKTIIQKAKADLCTLFGIAEDDLVDAGADEDIDITPPGEAPPQEDVPEDGDDDQQMGTGGIGTGDRIYGSNDVIYNPYTNTYVPYGQVYDEYNNKLLQMQRDGLIPPDFEDFINEYFRSLSDYDAEN